MRAFVVAPPDPVVTWEEAKVHLRLDGDDEQSFVVRLIAAATGHIDGPDGWLGRALGPQILEVRLPDFRCGKIELPFRPIIDVVSLHYLDGEGVPVLLDADAYELFGPDLGCAWGKNWPVPGSWPGHTEAVRIQYRAGYARDPKADPLVQNVPEPIKQAILLMVGDMYRFRGTASDMNITAVSIPMSTTVTNLLSPYQVYD